MFSRIYQYNQFQRKQIITQIPDTDITLTRNNCKTLLYSIEVTTTINFKVHKI